MPLSLAVASTVASDAECQPPPPLPRAVVRVVRARRDGVVVSMSSTSGVENVSVIELPEPSLVSPRNVSFHSQLTSGSTVA